MKLDQSNELTLLDILELEQFRLHTGITTPQRDQIIFSEHLTIDEMNPSRIRPRVQRRRERARSHICSFLKFCLNSYHLFICC